MIENCFSFSHPAFVQSTKAGIQLVLYKLLINFTFDTCIYYFKIACYEFKIEDNFKN